MGKDAVGTLKKAADMGYYSLETASYADGKIYGMLPLELKKRVDDLGMKLPVVTSEARITPLKPMLLQWNGGKKLLKIMLKPV